MKRKTLLIIALVALFVSPCFSEEPLSKYLLQKRAELDQRELKLKSREEALKELELKIQKKIKQYNSILASLEKLIKQLKQTESERFLHVVKTYEKMSPDEAAAQFEQLDEEMAVKILSKMKERKAAALLARMSPERAARLIERLTSFKDLNRMVSDLRRR